MSSLSKFDVKTVVRSSQQDPIQQRRQKIVLGILDQLKALEAAQKNETYEISRKKWSANEHGEKVLIEKLHKVRPWFFQQDGGWYVQCKYGNRVLKLGTGNAVFVKQISDVKGALNALNSAAEAGDLDTCIAAVLDSRSISKEQ